MYFQGKKIRKTIPKLPEASGPKGIVTFNSGKKFRILCLGESTIAGIGVATHEEGFAGSLAKELSTRIEASILWTVLAKSGYTAKDVEQHLVPKIDQSYDLIVIGLGGNDAFKLNSPMRWKTDVQMLINSIRIKNPLTPLAFTNMPAIKHFPAFTWTIRTVIGGRCELLRQALVKVVDRNENVYFSSEAIDMIVWAARYNVQEDPSAFFSDGVHPSMLTYQVWAKDFAKFLSTKLN